MDASIEVSPLETRLPVALLDVTAARRLAEALAGGSVDHPCIADYIVDRGLGAGGGSPYAARLPGAPGGFIVHLIPGQASEAAVEMLDRMSRFRHPGVARLFERGDHEGSLYVSFCAIEGTALGGYCHGVGRRERIALLARIAEIVGEMHENDLAHGDLRPENVIINADGDPVLTHAGIAALPGFGVVRPSIPAGSSCSPGGTAHDPAGSGPLPIALAGVRGHDICGLGRIVGAILPGPPEEDARSEPPHVEPDDQTPRCAARQIVGAIPAGRGSSSLRALIGRALATTAGNRLMTAGDLARALHQQLEDRGVESIGA